MRQDGLILAAGRVRSKRKNGFKKTKSHHTHNTPRIHSSPATATTLRQLTTKHVPRVRSYTPASIDFGFVEISIVQLSQSAKMANVTRTETDTDRPVNNGTRYAHRYEEAILPPRQKTPSLKTTNVTHRQTDRHTKQRMAPCAQPGTSREVNEVRRPHTCSGPCSFEEKNEK